MELYVNISGKVHGPFTPDKLKKLASKGKIKPDTKIGKAKEGPWRKCSQVKGLFPKPQTDVVKVTPTTLVAPPVPQQVQQTPFQQPPFQQPPQFQQSQFQQPRPAKEVEQTIWKGSPSQMNNFKSYVLCALFCWLIIPVFVAVWKFLVTKSQKYEVTTQRIRYSSGIFARSIQEVELYRVKDSRFSQTGVQRMFGLADILLVTSDAQSPNKGILGISGKVAQPLREDIRERVEDARDRKGVREIDMR